MMTMINENDADFDPALFEVLASLQDKSFWYKIRNNLIIWALKKYAINFSSFLEIGCGTGFVLSDIVKNFSHAKIMGADFFIESFPHAKKRLPESVELIQMDARKIPFTQNFDVIGAFDVIEHIDEDILVLENIFDALKDGGLLFMTVPQHPWLWSYLDEYACHKRRYAINELETKAKKIGFQIIRSTSFVSMLLPMMILSRIFNKKNDKKDLISELKINSLLNFCFEKILSLELLTIKCGLNYPLGGSRFIIAKKLTHPEFYYE